MPQKSNFYRRTKGHPASERKQIAADLRSARRLFSGIKENYWDPKNRVRLLEQAWHRTTNPEASTYLMKKIREIKGGRHAKAEMPAKEEMQRIIHRENREGIVNKYKAEKFISTKDKKALVNAVKHQIRLGREGLNFAGYAELDKTIAKLIGMSKDFGHYDYALELLRLRSILSVEWAKESEEPNHLIESMDYLKHAQGLANNGGYFKLAKRLQAKLKKTLEEGKRAELLNETQIAKLRSQYFL